MPDAPSLRPATADEIAEALSFALREASGFVQMKGPLRVAPTTGGMPPGRGPSGGV